MVFADMMIVNASRYTTYPIILMFRSSNLLSVILVGVCCTSVRDRRLKLEKERIIGGIFVTISIFLFFFFDPENNDKSMKA